MRAATVAMCSNDTTLPTQGVLVLLDLLEADGIAARDVLAGTGLDRDDLQRPPARLSYPLLLRIAANAASLSDDPLVGARAGLRMTISDCGVFGFALLTSPTHHDASLLLLDYQRALNPLFRLSFDRDPRRGTWTVDPAFSLAETHAHRLLLEFQLAALAGVVNDLHGGGPRIGCLHLAGEAPPHAEALADLLGGEVSFGGARNQLSHPASFLDRPMPLANPITHDTLRAMCDQVLLGLPEMGEVSGIVKKLLLRELPRYADMEAMGRALAMNTRTLQRKLEAEGTSYRKLLAQARLRCAIDYLRNTRLTIEEISERLGYSDSANFRHAFMRWAHSTPQAFRQAGTALPTQGE